MKQLRFFTGAVIQPPKNCWLIVEYLPGGSLTEWLYGNSTKSAPRRSLQEKATMGLEIAKGLLVWQFAYQAVSTKSCWGGKCTLSKAALVCACAFCMQRHHVMLAALLESLSLMFILLDQQKAPCFLILMHT